MTRERDRYDHRWRERFPGAWAVVIDDEGAVFAVQDEIGFWLISDSGPPPEHEAYDEDDDLIDAMVDVARFEDESQWRTAIAYLQKKQPEAARRAQSWNEEA